MSDLYVDAAAGPNGDGSKRHPYDTIGEAVAAASAGTTIHVAEGTYREDLKTVFLKPDVRLKGSTVLHLDERGLPTGKTDHAAIVKPPATGVPKNGAIFQIQAENVVITGLVIDGTSNSAMPAGSLISVDGAQGPADGFRIQGNAFLNAKSLNAGTAVLVRLAAGTIRGNSIARQSVGAHIYSLSSDSRKRVLFEGNRMEKNFIAGALFYGSVGSRRAPAFKDLGVQDVEGLLRVTIRGNDFLENGGDPSEYPSNNPSTGLHFLLNDDSQSNPVLGARIVALVRENTFTDNVWYGIVVGQRIDPNQRLIGYAFEGTFERNRYRGNGLNAAAFCFRHIVVSHGAGSKHFRYGRGSTITIRAADDPLSRIAFDYDHPAVDCDPHDYLNPTEHEDPGPPLRNRLIFNGTPVPTHITLGPPRVGRQKASRQARATRPRRHS
jgi:hypothetical protein